MDENIRQIYIVVVTMDADSGSSAAAAEWQGWGASYAKAYLETKLPAGSPFKIGRVMTADGRGVSAQR